MIIKTIIKLMAILLIGVIFIGCDNPYKDINLYSNATAKGFVFDKDDVIMLTQYVTSINDIDNPHCLTATYRNET
ncbi:MAG: hypothetical protein ACI3ZZ_06760 [Candidatus Aphodosoma sp.]